MLNKLRVFFDKKMQRGGYKADKLPKCACMHITDEVLQEAWNGCRKPSV